MKPDTAGKIIVSRDGTSLDYASILKRADDPHEMAELAAAGISISESITDATIRAVPANWDEAIHYRLVPFARIRRHGTEKTFEAGTINGRPADYVIANSRIVPFANDFSEAFDSFTRSLDPSRIRLKDLLALLNLPEHITVFAFDLPELQSGRKMASTLDKAIAVPGLNAKLYPYQCQGVRWLNSILDDTGGAILADEMGLGKTIQIIAVLLLRKPTPNHPALIVCPTSLIDNWCRELQRFSPEFSIHIHRGALRTGIPSGLTVADIVITTYDTLVGDQLVFGRIRWSYIIADEAQALKNPGSQRRKAVASLDHDRMLAVTGTPVENTLLDLWSLSDLCVPGILGSWPEFQTRFPDTQESATRLSSMTGPIILKRRVTDVAKDLPERITANIPLTLPDKLAYRYEQIRKDILARYPKAGTLVATGQLQIFCAHPSLRGELIENCEEESEDDTIFSDSTQANLLTPKIERTLAILEEAFLSARKVLIFSAFNAVGPIVKNSYKGPEAAMWSAINGCTPQEKRQPIVDQFTAHEGPAVLILNPRAAGAGLNITAATVVIHFVPVWNPAIEAQASARAYRRGQNEPVTIYRLFYTGTVEEVMIERTSWKNKIAGQAVIITQERNRNDISRALSISPLALL
jgi:SNF2 family DNA or RNA helicase